MYKLKFFFSWVFIWATITFSQVTPIGSSSEMFNERGLSGDLNFRPNSKEIVSDYNGNLLIQYQTPLSIPDELSGEFVVTYNANVGHRAFNYRSPDNYNGFMINAPEWILGYKGIALQTLNFETHNYIRYNGQAMNYGEEVPLLIPGYHFTNNLHANYNNSASKDFIQILMADGTVTILENVDQYSSSTNSRQGLYIDKSIDRYGIARVEIFNQHFRRIWYKPGDGLTYYFEEESITYNDEGPNGDIESIRQEDPKVMYLKKITAPSGDELEFLYSNQLDGQSITYGRKVFVGINSNRRTSHSSDYELLVSYEWDGYLKSVQINNYNYDDLLKLHILNANTELLGTSRNQAGSRILYLEQVEDKIERYDYFQYYLLTDVIVNRVFSYSSDDPRYSFGINYNFYLINKINFYNQQNIQYEYFGESYSGLPATLFLHLEKQQHTPNVTYAFRDCFTNYMINKRKEFNNTQLVKTETYDYTRIGTGDMASSSVNDIITTITIENNLSDNSSPSIITKVKNFSKYNVHSLNYTLGDINCTIKLAEEKEGGGTEGYFKKTYSYDIGTLQIAYPSYYYDGTFNLESTTIDRNDGVNATLTHNQNITNNYSVVNFRNAASSIVSSKKIFSSIIKDEENVHTEISYKNYTATDYYPTLSTAYFYKIGLTESEKIYSGTLVKKEKLNTYFTSGELISKINRVTDVLSDNNYIAYDYYTSSTNNFYKGFLKSETNNLTGLKKEYYYPSATSSNDWEISDIGDGKVIKYDNTVYPKTFSHIGFQSKPFKTITYFKNSTNSSNADQTLSGTTNLEIWNNNTIRNLNVNPQTIQRKGTPIITTKDSYSFLNEPVILNDKFINDGILTINIKVDLLNPFDIMRGFEIYGVTEQYRSGETNYQTQLMSNINLPVGSLGNYVILDIDLKNALVDLQNSNKDLYGFRFVVPFDISGGIYEVRYLISGNPQFEFHANTYTPENISTYTSYDKKGNLNFAIDENGNYSQYSYDGMGRMIYEDLPYSFYDIDNSNHSSIYEYFDSENYMTQIERFDNNPSNLKNRVTKKEYDPLGQLIKTSVNDDAGVYFTKEEKKYNYLGLVYEKKTGTNVTTKYTYDYLSRKKSSQMGTLTAENYLYRWETGNISNGSTSIPYYGKKTVTDPSGKLKYIYFDKLGNIIAEKSGSNIPLIFSIDNIYRVTSALSPGGLSTTYTYDDKGYLDSRISPDEGEYKYKYDKYGNLRFEYHTSSTPSEIVFSRYDDFNNLIATGIQQGNINDFNALEPNYNYSFETDTSKLIVVNMYNNYFNTGVYNELPDISPEMITAMNIKNRLVAVAFRDKPGESFNHKLYRYDPAGRIKEFDTRLAPYDWKCIYNTYDNSGNMTEQNVQNIFYYWYDYDLQGRLKEVRTNDNDSKLNATLESSYSYNDADQVGSVLNPAGNVEYNYNPQSGWVENIQQSANMFREQLSYFDNGNIDQQTITNHGSAAWQNLTFNYTYDYMNRLTNSTVSNASFNETFSYSEDGNLLTKNRSGKNIAYNYGSGTNKLQTAVINSNNYNYNYDLKGNLISDSRKNIALNSYNYRNLPTQMIKGTENYYYRYDEDGNRIYKKTPNIEEYYLRDHLNRELAIYDPLNDKVKMLNIFGNDLIGKVVSNAYVNLQLTSTTLVGNYEALNTINAETNVVVNGTATLIAGASIHLKPGFTANSGSNFIAKIGAVINEIEKFYYIKDHLGNIRVTTDETGVAVGGQDYYAYGEILRAINDADVYDKYKFTEKERDSESEYDYFGARYYDCELGNWLTADPLADNYPSWSPYTYTLNNPLRFTDPDGRGSWQFIPGIGFVWQLDPVIVTAEPTNDPWFVSVATEKLDKFSAQYGTNSAQVLPVPTFGPLPIPLPPSVATAEQNGKAIRGLVSEIAEYDWQLLLVKMLGGLYLPEDDDSDYGPGGFQKMPNGNNQHFNKMFKEALKVLGIKEGSRRAEQLHRALQDQGTRTLKDIENFAKENGF